MRAPSRVLLKGGRRVYRAVPCLGRCETTGRCTTRCREANTSCCASRSGGQCRCLAVEGKEQHPPCWGCVAAASLYFQIEHHAHYCTPDLCWFLACRLGRIAFHPAGRHLGTASYDLTWRLWDCETGHCLLEQEGHSRSVYTVAFQVRSSGLRRGCNCAAAFSVCVRSILPCTLLAMWWRCVHRWLRAASLLLPPHSLVCLAALHAPLTAIPHRTSAAVCRPISLCSGRLLAVSGGMGGKRRGALQHHAVYSDRALCPAEPLPRLHACSATAP